MIESFYMCALRRSCVSLSVSAWMWPGIKSGFPGSISGVWVQIRGKLRRGMRFAVVDHRRMGTDSRVADPIRTTGESFARLFSRWVVQE